MYLWTHFLVDILSGFITFTLYKYRRVFFTEFPWNTIKTSRVLSILMNVRAISMQNSNVVRLLKLLSLINFLHQSFCVFTSNWAVGKFHGRFGQQKQSNSKLQNLRHLNSIKFISENPFLPFTTFKFDQNCEDNSNFY